MSHLKRQAIPKSWPVPRKGTAYLIKPSFGKSEGIPLLVVLRDMLKIVATRRELKTALNKKLILVNTKIINDEKYSLLLFDTLTLTSSKKSYRLTLNKIGKFSVEEIKENDSTKKIAKIVNKRLIKNKKTQLNFSDGRNFISDIKCNTNDSGVIDFKNKKIEKCLPLKEKSRVMVFKGKHTGETGTIKKIDLEKKMIEISEGERSINVLIKQVMVIE